MCKEERPDAKIGVRKDSRLINGIKVGRNVRYCIDRSACYDAAVELARSFLDRLEGTQA